MVCLWDEKSHAKMYKALQDDILEFIKQAQTVSSNLYFAKTFNLILLCANREFWLMKKISLYCGRTSLNGESFLHNAPTFQCLSFS